MNATDFFKRITASPTQPVGQRPYPYQARLMEEPWPEVLAVPTGLGKTKAVLIAWLRKRLQNDVQTGRRLVYCLPMRTLVRQTQEVAEQLCAAVAADFEEQGRPVPTVHVLLGGEVDATWDADPTREAILIGTQDMLLSRALNRGYALSRYRWPMHFGLLSNDALWVFDETQLFGVGLETSAQLAGLRQAMGTFGNTRSLWMSATLSEAHLSTVDHRRPQEGFARAELDAADNDQPEVRKRLEALKQIAPVSDLLLSVDAAKSPRKNTPAPYITKLAEHVLQTHQDQGDLTLVVLNRVDRAQALFAELKAQQPDLTAGLIHSRYRPADRKVREAILEASGPRVVVATQVVEAGVDVSAKTLITELCPWASLVQRFGRCNRSGEYSDSRSARIEWIDAVLPPNDAKDAKNAQGLLLPYQLDQLRQAREHLLTLQENDQGAGPKALGAIEHHQEREVRPVLRRRDLLALFDTSSDLSGDDLDVSRYVRDDSSPDVFLHWCDFDEQMLAAGRQGPSGKEVGASHVSPAGDALCRVGIGAAKMFLETLAKEAKKRHEKKDHQEANRYRGLSWNPLLRTWTMAAAKVLRPGMVIALDAKVGGYDVEQGWIGAQDNAAPVPEVTRQAQEARAEEDAHDDNAASSNIGKWVLLEKHLGHVRDEAKGFAARTLPVDLHEVLATAGLWHDVGKAHAEFQGRLLDPLSGQERPTESGSGIWAKSNHNRRSKREPHRRYFRHELASMLAWLKEGGESDPRIRNLVAYLVVAHHGKIRVSLRSLPKEQPPNGSDCLFAHGVMDGDAIEKVQIPGHALFQDVKLDLSLMQLGEGSWLERVLLLRDAPDLGPFRLALLETVLRAADWKASHKEQHEGYEND